MRTGIFFEQRLVAAVVAILLGADPATAATFRIEIDYMVDTSPGGHSHMPTQQELDAVIEMFACQGHTLIIELSDAIPHHDVLRRNPDNDALFSYDGEDASFGSLKAEYFDHAGEGGWHYCIFGHQYEGIDDDGNYFDSGSSGIAELNGDDLLVTMGTFTGQIGTSFDRASTLAHEFGHNLGLTHCGAGNCGDVGPNSPVLASIMSYNYQLQGLRTGLLCNALIPESASDLFKEMDYSHGRLISLDENSLNESLGTAWRSVDWDCSGSVGGIVAQDLSTDGPTWCANSGNLEVIADYDEWANIQDATKLRSPAELKDPPTIACITSQEVAALKRAVCAQPALAVESCTTGSLYYVGNGGSHGGDGTWADPIGSVGSAQSGAVPGSAIILLPGTYDESGGSLLLDKPARYYSAATGSVVR